MIRVLFIARYRDKTMWRKVELLAQQPNLAIKFVFPAFWQDDMVQLAQKEITGADYEQYPISFIGPPSDPHRTFYRSLHVGIAGFDPHIIHVEEEPDSLAALQVAIVRRLWAPNAKLILLTWQNVNRPKKFYVEWIMQLTLAASDCVMCANQAAIHLLHQRGYAKPTPLLPPIGADTTTFFPAEAHSAPDSETTEEVNIAYIGRLSPEKDIPLLLKSFAQLKPTHQIQLKLIGSGAEEHALQELATALGIREKVDFVGAMPLAEIAKTLRDLDILVLPSRSTSVWKEQFGRVLTEAMASRVVVVGSDSGAIPEVIGDAGFIFPEGDMQALAAILQKLVDSPELRREFAERGYQRVLGMYTQKKIAEQTVELYKQILG